MAVIKMTKLAVTGLSAQKEALIKKLMRLGCTELIDQSELLETPEWRALVMPCGNEGRMREIENKIGEASKALELLEAFAPSKRELFAKKRKAEALKGEQIKMAEETCARLLDLKERLSSLKAEGSACLAAIESLSNWADYSLPLELERTRFAQIFVGNIPAASNIKSLTEELSGELSAYEFEVLHSDNMQHYVCGIVHITEAQKMLDILRAYGFTRAHFGDMKGTAKSNIFALEENLSFLRGERDKINDEILKVSLVRERLERYYDHLLVERDALVAEKVLLGTESSFYFLCYVPEEAAEKVKDTLLSEFTCVVRVIPLSEGEDYPILLRNSKLVRPFEVLTEQYGLPVPGMLDPSAVMAPFFFIFFGMMLSDALYGIILSLFSVFMLKKYRPEGTAEKFLSLFAICGISTFFWGAIFGGWFGNFIPALKPVIDPLNEPIKVLVLSFALGGIHLFAGLGVKAYLLIKRGQWLDAICDVGFISALLLGLTIMLLEYFGVLAPTPAGKYTALVGAVGMVLTQGRSEKGLFKKLLSGLGSLYGVSGYLSDVLSYSRLFALGLSTGVIASVVNTMGRLGGPVVYVIVFILGHSVNLAINTLGAYVHSARLQYVEFFGKFYEGGGKPFSPLRINTKYTTLEGER